MPIPESILQVPRPKSTRVKNVNNRYKVIKRSCVRVGGRNIPVELGVVGEIVGGSYVAYPSPNLKTLEEAKASLVSRLGDVGAVSPEASPRRAERHFPRPVYDIKVSGSVRLVDGCGCGLLQSLTAHFGIEEARFVYVVALLRAAMGEVKDNALKDEYESSMVSELYPGVGLSENTVSSYLRRIGVHSSAVRDFQKARVTELGGGVTVVDGSLLDFNSPESIYSEFSRKGQKKGSRDLSVMTAYSVDTGEPLCEEIYPGNMLDMTAFEDFSKRFGLTDAVLVARPLDERVDTAGDPSCGESGGTVTLDVKLFDKGFSSRELIDSLRKAGKHYIVALRNDLAEIRKYGLDNPCNYLRSFREDTVMWKKVAIEDALGKRLLYAFKCPRMGYLQSTGYVRREDKKGRFSPEKYDAKQPTFGLIVFESDLDVDASKVYAGYDDRWKIELYEKLRKSIADNGAVNVHSDPAVRGTEFINLVSNIMMCRLRTKMEESGVAKKYSTKEVLRKLSHVLEEKNDDGVWERRFILKNTDELCAKLGVNFGGVGGA